MEPISTMHISTDHVVDVVRGSQSLTKLGVYLPSNLQAHSAAIKYLLFLNQKTRLKITSMQ